MAPSMLGDKGGILEEMFKQKLGYPNDSLVGMVKCVAAYMVFALAKLNVEELDVQGF